MGVAGGPALVVSTVGAAQAAAEDLLRLAVALTADGHRPHVILGADVDRHAPAAARALEVLEAVGCRVAGPDADAAQVEAAADVLLAHRPPGRGKEPAAGGGDADAGGGDAGTLPEDAGRLVVLRGAMTDRDRARWAAMAGGGARVHLVGSDAAAPEDLLEAVHRAARVQVW